MVLFFKPTTLQKIIAGDELLSDSFPYKEVENGVLWEVQGKVGLHLIIASKISIY